MFHNCQVSCFYCYFAVETTALVSGKHVTFLSYLLIFFLGIIIFGERGSFVENWVCGSFGMATWNVSSDYELVNFSDVYMFMQNIFPSGALFPCSLKNSSLFIEKIHYQNVVFFSEKPNLFLPCRNWEGPPSKDTVQAKAQELFSSGSGWMDQFSIEMLIQIIQLSLLLFLLYRKETFLQSV